MPMLKKMKCCFGFHEFYAGDIEMVHIVEYVYRAIMTCRNCGIKQCAMIRVPIPPRNKEENEIRNLGNYALFDENATHEDIKKAVMEDAAERLVEIGALEIIIKDIPYPCEDEDEKVKMFKSGGWTINLPTREGGTI